MVSERLVPVDIKTLPQDLRWFEESKDRQYASQVPDVDEEELKAALAAWTDQVNVEDEEDEREEWKHQEQVVDLTQETSSRMEFLNSTRIEYVREKGKVYQIEYVSRGKSILDLLMEYLSVDKNHPRQQWDEFPAMLRRASFNIPDSAIAPTEQRPGEIAAAVERLCLESRCKSTFEFGKKLGRVFGESVFTEGHYLHMEELLRLPPEWHEISAEELESLSRFTSSQTTGEDSTTISLDDALERSWGRFVDEMNNDPVFLYFFTKEHLIRNGKGLFSGRYFGMSHEANDDFSEINVLLCIRTSLCLILGKILGGLHEVDREEQIRDSAKTVPRAMSISALDRREKIAGAIWLNQQVFNEQLGGDVLPETLVGNIANAIEVIARNLWPEFSTDESISKLLQEKRRAGTPLEKEFAMIAQRPIALRNSIVHQPNTFRCSILEAKLFFAEIQVLDEKADQIRKERERTKS